MAGLTSRNIISRCRLVFSKSANTNEPPPEFACTRSSRTGARSAEEAVDAKGQVSCRESYSNSSNSQAADLVPSPSTLPPIFRLHRHSPSLPRISGGAAAARPHISEKNEEWFPEYTDRRVQVVSEDYLICYGEWLPITLLRPAEMHENRSRLTDQVVPSRQRIQNPSSVSSSTTGGSSAGPDRSARLRRRRRGRVVIARLGCGEG